MEVRSSTPHGSPEDRGVSEGLLDLTRKNREGVRTAVERADKARDARNRELRAETDRAEKSKQVAQRVGEVVREGMIARPSGSSHDRLELSPAGLAAARDTEAVQKGASNELDQLDRPGHLAALKAALETGELFSRERLEKAADRLLGAEVEA